VTRFVPAAHDYALRIPAQARPYNCRAIPQRQPAAPLLRLVRFRTMQEQVAVNRNLAGFQLYIDRLSQALDAGHGLIQNIPFVVLAERICQMAQVVRTGYVSHARIFDARVVNRQPGRDSHRRRQRPIARVLVPGDPLAVPRHFAKEMRAPGHYFLAKQVFDSTHNARVRQNIVDASVAQVRRADGITIAARGQRLRQEVVKVTPYICYLVCIENPKAGQVSIAIKRFDLLRRQHLGASRCRGMEAQVAFHLAQIFGGRNKTRRRWGIHRLDAVSLSLQRLGKI